MTFTWTSLSTLGPRAWLRQLYYRKNPQPQLKVEGDTQFYVGKRGQIFERDRFTRAFLFYDMNQQDQNGLTPLHRAVTTSNLEAVRTLCHAGANFTLGDNYGETPLQLAGELQRATRRAQPGYRETFSGSGYDAIIMEPCTTPTAQFLKDWEIQTNIWNRKVSRMVNTTKKMLFISLVAAATLYTASHLFA